MKVSADSKAALKAIKDAKSVGLLVPPGATVDTVSASLALYHLFFSGERKVTPIVPGQIPKEVLALPASAAIRSDFGPKKLVVTLNTSRTPIEKVSYRAEEGKFQLVIHPLERTFSVEDVEYSYEGLDFDLLIILGVQKISDLGELYQKNKAEFSKTTIINMDVSPSNENYGQINIVDPSRSCLSELIFRQLLAWEMVPSKEAARCLLTGLATISPAQPTEITVEKKPGLTKKVGFS